MSEREIKTPHSVEMESSTLGAMMTERVAVVRAMSLLSAEDFWRPMHRKIFTAIVSLYDAGEACDMLRVHEELSRRKQAEECGGVAYLTALWESCASAVNVESYAKVVLEKSILRQLLKAAEEIIKDVHSAEDGAAEVAARAEKRVLAIGRNRTRDTFVPLCELVDAECRDIQTASQNQHSVVGTPTGFYDFDEMTGGLEDGDIITVGGRPSMGKTAWCLQVAEHVASSRKLPVAVLSLEMGDKQLTRRLLAGESSINSKMLRRGNLSDSEWQRLADASLKLKQVPLFIRDTPRASMYDIKAHCRRLESEQGRLGLIMIDHLGLMKAEGANTNRVQQIGEMMHDIKALAKEMNCPVLLLCQLGRKVEERDDKRPVLSDFRESGDIEQDTDVALFLYRDAYYQRKKKGESWGAEPDDNIAELIIAKQREGEQNAVIKLRFEKEFARFENLAKGAF
jgi:replicative DNA helicase